LSKRIDEERAEEARHQRIERAKCVLRQLQAVLAYSYEGVHVAEQARRLEMSRDRVRWMQRVLGLRSGRIKSGWLSTAVGSESRGMVAA
jgi:hypothetical protein